MSYETLIITKKDDITTVTLNRPEVHNAMNETLMKELTHCFQHLSVDDSVTAVILTGNGKSFCAGADLTWMKQWRSTGNELELAIPWEALELKSPPAILDFKWADYCIAAGDWTDFTLNGDAAPNDRFNYRARLNAEPSPARGP